jgi:predicted  nucleic acid-binding Zn-ribbon protein
MTVLRQDPSSLPEILESGEPITEVRPGLLVCVACGWAFSPLAPEALPACPGCGGRRFRRASLFEPAGEDPSSVSMADQAPEWLVEVRAELDQPGRYLAFDAGDGELTVIRLERGWTRIGRSRAADLRLDDATVSRRHALVVLTEPGELRALDDRSLNGLFVNGERVEWAALADGDELEIGRFRIYVLEA